MSTIPATAADVIALVPAAATVGAPSTGTILVVSTPVPPGTVIEYLGRTLTAVAVARTPGANNFNGALLSTSAIAADILAALQDATNDWASVVTASLVGSTISLTTIAKGYSSEAALTSTGASVTTTGLTGGAYLLTALLALASSMVSIDCWGDKVTDATRALALHFLSQVEGGIAGGGGVASSIKIADISKTFAVATPTDALYGSTAWGRMYLALYETVYCAGTTGAHYFGVTG